MIERERACLFKCVCVCVGVGVGVGVGVVCVWFLARVDFHVLGRISEMDIQSLQNLSYLVETLTCFFT